MDPLSEIEKKILMVFSRNKRHTEGRYRNSVQKAIRNTCKKQPTCWQGTTRCTIEMKFEELTEAKGSLEETRALFRLEDNIAPPNLARMDDFGSVK